MRRLLVAASITAAVGLAASAMLDRLDNHRHRIGALLDLKDIPSSVRDVACSSAVSTDVLTTCVFAIDPADFQRLLVSWPLRERSVVGTSHEFDVADQSLGSGFEADTQVLYEETGLPFRRFPHGGALSLVTNEARDRAQVSLYVE